MTRFHRAAGTALLTLLAAGPLAYEARGQTGPSDSRGGRILSYELTWEVTEPGRARKTVRIEALVEGPNGRDIGYAEIPYDAFTKVAHVRGAIRDPDGRLRRKMDGDDIEDRSAIDDVSLYDDARVRSFRLLDDRYPYVIEVEFEVRHDGLLAWPAWYPHSGDYPVDRSTFRIRAPRTMEVRYAIRGELPEPDITTDTRTRQFLWETGGLEPFEPEEWGPPWEEQAPHVVTGPTRFEIDDYPGWLSSWSGLGQWYGAVSSGRRRLPEEVVRNLRNGTRGMDTLAAARYVYDRLQDATRYVSVQLGIGGWRPHEAEYVLERGYGDCKALTNYLQAMLEAVGIRARPALIRLGSDAAEIGADFPRFAFNHVILAVPTVRDTVWLEATSQVMPFGWIGPWNEDRHALLVGPDGGELVRTPATPATRSRQHRIADITVGSGGSALADVRITLTGNQHAAMLSRLSQADDRDRAAFLRQNGGVGTFGVTRADFGGIGTRSPAGVLVYGLDFPRIGVRTGQRLLVPVNMLGRIESIPPEMPERTQPVVYAYAFVDTDSVTIRYPDGFTLEALPDNVHLEYPFGSYTASLVQVPEMGVLLYRRRFEITRRRIEPAEYEDMRTFLAGVARAERAHFVLTR